MIKYLVATMLGLGLLVSTANAQWGFHVDVGRGHYHGGYGHYHNRPYGYWNRYPSYPNYRWHDSYRPRYNYWHYPHYGW